jgi:hypothetical protein
VIHLIGKFFPSTLFLNLTAGYPIWTAPKICSCFFKPSIFRAFRFLSSMTPPASPQAGPDTFYLCIQDHVVQGVLCTLHGQGYPSIANNKHNSRRIRQDVPPFKCLLHLDPDLWVKCRRELPDVILQMVALIKQLTSYFFQLPI